MKFININRIVFLSLILLSMMGCTHAKTWELDHLKKPEMSLDHNTMNHKTAEHINQSKEAASNVTVDGSGCSCY